MSGWLGCRRFSVVRTHDKARGGCWSDQCQLRRPNQSCTDAHKRDMSLRAGGRNLGTLGSRAKSLQGRSLRRGRSSGTACAINARHHRQHFFFTEILWSDVASFCNRCREIHLGPDGCSHRSQMTRSLQLLRALVRTHSAVSPRSRNALQFTRQIDVTPRTSSRDCVRRQLPHMRYRCAKDRSVAGLTTRTSFRPIPKQIGP